MTYYEDRKKWTIYELQVAFCPIAVCVDTETDFKLPVICK